jgi:rhamnulokinase
MSLPTRLFAICDPATSSGRSAAWSRRPGYRRTGVTLVGSHDTASAVVAAGGRPLHVRAAPVVTRRAGSTILTEASRLANFTNEGGVDGRVRYLRNVMGLWLLQESMRTWERTGTPEDLGRLLQAAAALPGGGPIVDPDEPVFLPPGDMPRRVEEVCGRDGRPVPASRPALVRCILDSLAAAYARTIVDVVRLSGRDVDTVHSSAAHATSLLCQLTADACGRPVVAVRRGHRAETSSSRLGPGASCRATSSRSGRSSGDPSAPALRTGRSPTAVA